MNRWQSAKNTAKYRLRRGLGIEGLRTMAETVLSRIELAIDRTEQLSRRLEKLEVQLTELRRAGDELTATVRRLEASQSIVSTERTTGGRTRELVRQ